MEFPVVKEYDEWQKCPAPTMKEEILQVVHRFLWILRLYLRKQYLEEEQRIIRQQEEAERAEAERCNALRKKKEDVTRRPEGRKRLKKG